MPKPVKKTAKPPIFHLRKAANKTQSEFASELGMHRVTLAKAESYECGVPGARISAKIGAALGKTRGQIIDDYSRHVEGAS